MPNIQTTEYKEFIKQIKTKVRQAQIKASVKVNIVLFYARAFKYVDTDTLGA